MVAETGSGRRGRGGHRGMEWSQRYGVAEVGGVTEIRSGRRGRGGHRGMKWSQMYGVAEVGAHSEHRFPAPSSKLCQI